MSVQALFNATIWLDRYNVSGLLNDVDVEEKFAELLTTNFGSGGCVERIAGLNDWTVKVGGMWDTDVQPGLDTLSGQAGKLIVVTPNGTENDVCHFGRGLVSGFKKGGKIGEVAHFDGQVTGGSGVSATTRGEGLAHGRLLAARAQRTADGSSTGFDLGGALSTQKLYAVLVVFAVTGTTPTLDVIIESDASGAFSSPTTVATFAQQSAAGAVFLTPVSGPVTDTFYRATWDVGGTSPNFDMAVGFAIK